MHGRVFTGGTQVAQDGLYSLLHWQSAVILAVAAVCLFVCVCACVPAPARVVSPPDISSIKVSTG